MRWLLRFLIAWAIGIPIFYFVGIPYMLKEVTNKTRVDTLAECERQYAAVNGQNPEKSVVAMTDLYCHCMADDLTFTKHDLFDLVRKQQPVEFQKQLEAKGQACVSQREQYMSDPNHAPVTTKQGDREEIVF